MENSSNDESKKLQHMSTDALVEIIESIPSKKKGKKAKSKKKTKQ